MRILIIHCKYQQRGGEDFVVEEEFEVLCKKHEVEVLYFQNKSGWKGALSMLFYPFNLRSAKKVRRKVNSFQPDIIHLHNFHYAAGPMIIRTAKAAGVPIVMTLHNFRLICPSATLYFEGEQLKNSLIEDFPWTAVRKGVISKSRLKTFWLAFTMWLHRKVGTFDFIDTFIALNSSQKETFLVSKWKIPAEKIIVKPNFCPPASSAGLNEKGKHFLFLGRLSEEKGIKTLLEAFSRSNAILKIAGAGPLLSEVMKSSRQHSNIIYLGELSKDQVQAELSSCSALIFSSVWPETFGLVIIEAFSAGTPVIASKVGAASEIVKDGFNGLHFHPKDSADLRKKIEDWGNLPEETKKQLSKYAYQTWLQHYMPEVNLHLLENIYQDTIHSFQAR